MNKKIIGVSLGVAVVLVSLFLATQRGKNEAGEIKIGAVLPLTGDLASYGQNARDGILLYAERLNADGGINGQPVNIQFEDTAGQPAQAVSALKKLLTVDKAIAVIGGISSSTTLAMAPVANKNEVVLLSPAASAPSISAAGPFVYRVWPSDVFESGRMAAYVMENNIENIAVLYVNNDYGKAMVKSFRLALRDTAPKVVVAEDNFDPDSTDVRTQLSRIRTSEAEWIYLISYPKDSAIILRQMTELGLKTRILATSSFEDPLILAAPGQTTEGSIFTSPVPPASENQVVADFQSAYKEKFGKEPGLVADYGFDSLLVLAEAIKAGDASREGIARGIDALKSLQGASGLIELDENGDVLKPAGIKTIKDGKYVWLEQ
jgi:branched-chain amino acid transport system substrate-binding protein